MARRLAILALGSLTACGSSAERELEAVKSARSLLSEWALVEMYAKRGETPLSYASAMHDEARSQIATAAKSLENGQPDAAALLTALTAGVPSPAELKAAADRLGPLEDRLEHS